MLFTAFKSGIKSFTGHLEPLNTQEVALIRTILVLPALTSRSRFLHVAAELSRDLFGCRSKLWKLWPHLTICGDTIQYTTQYTIQKYNNHVLDIFLTFCTNLLIFLQRYCEDEEDAPYISSLAMGFAPHHSGLLKKKKNSVPNRLLLHSHLRHPS